MIQQLRYRERSGAERLKLSRTCDVKEKRAGSWLSCVSLLEMAQGPVAAAKEVDILAAIGGLCVEDDARPVSSCEQVAARVEL